MCNSSALTTGQIGVVMDVLILTFLEDFPNHFGMRSFVQKLQGSGFVCSASILDLIDRSLFVGNLLYAAVSDCTLVGQLDAEFIYREIFFNVLQDMLNNFFKHMVSPCFFHGIFML